MLKTGFIGWRGVVGSVLMKRMQEENDFSRLDATFYSTSQAGQKAPSYIHGSKRNLQDAYDLSSLRTQDILVSTQGGDYTEKVYAKLRETGWHGFWIDAASSLRMNKDSIIVLDPINAKQIRKGLASGVKNYIGGNCTVSLMLLAIHGLLEENLVDAIQVSTYQAISGAGAEAMNELFQQFDYMTRQMLTKDKVPAKGLGLEKDIHYALTHCDLPTNKINGVLAANLLPWIDKAVDGGRTKEEWKGHVETNKILDRATVIPVDSTCVRVATLRSHCQSLVLKLKEDLSVREVEMRLQRANPWVHLIPNERQDTLNYLTPIAAADSLKIKVGRVRKMNLGPEFVQMFTVGDQLLWGAAEPLRRTLKIILDRNETL